MPIIRIRPKQSSGENLVSNDWPSGIDSIRSVRCGTHFCEFHSTYEQLADTLAPYFAAGIQQDDFCVWITSDPTGVEGAKKGLRQAAPYLDRYIDSGQIEVWDHREWYLRGGHFEADRVFGQWVEKEKRSLDAGYKALRATGDMAWLEQKDRPAFMAYEAEVNRAFPQRRMIGLCTYSLDGFSADEMLEVVRNHHFTLARTDGGWEMLESSRTSVFEQLQRLSAGVLEQQDDQRRWIATQLHEVTAQNVSAIAMQLASLQQTTSSPSAVRLLLAKCHALCERSLEQILTLSRLLHPVILDEFGLAVCLRQYIEDFMKESRIHVELETGEIERLPLQVETHLFRVAQEGLSNILRHSGSLCAAVRLNRQEDQVVLQIEDFGGGVPTSFNGLGILEIQERLRKIGGVLEIRSNDRGTLLTASVRVGKL